MSRLLVWSAAAAVGLGGLAGCGSSSSSSSSSSSTNGSSASQTATTTSQSATPLSQQDYETQGVAALQGAEMAQKAASAQSNAATWGQVGAAYLKAHDAFQALVPPHDVADLHGQIVAVLATIGQAANRVSDAFNNGGVGGTGGQAAVHDFAAQAQKLVSLGQQYRTRGYTRLGS